MKITVALTATTLAGLIALGTGGCSGQSSSVGAKPSAGSSSSAGLVRVIDVPTAAPATGAATSTTAAPAPVDGTKFRYQKIAEPFSSPGECKDDGTALQMTACILEAVVDVDSSIDAAQLQLFELAAPSHQAALLAQDASWLHARSRSCDAEATTGGSIDQIVVAKCLLKVSRARADKLGA